MERRLPRIAQDGAEEHEQDEPALDALSCEAIEQVGHFRRVLKRQSVGQENRRARTMSRRDGEGGLRPVDDVDPLLVDDGEVRETKPGTRTQGRRGRARYHDPGSLHVCVHLRGGWSARRRARSR